MKKLFLIVSTAVLLADTQLAGQSLLLNDQPGNTAAKLNVQTPASSLFVAGSSLPEVLDHVFDSLTAISVIKGFNASVLLPDGTLWKRASGLAEQIPAQIDLTTDHLMGMGSISKSFVSATLLLLHEDGLLSLDDSIGQYLEPYENVPGHTTIRQLLSHRSGINDYLNENPAMSEAWLTNLDSIWVADTILHNYVLAPNFPVGTNWSYSNTNYLLAGRIIEHITGQPWYEVVRSRILNPYNLSHTLAYPWESYGTQPFSHAWADFDGNGTVEDLQGLGLPDQGLFSLAGSAGCLLSTPEDLVQFSRLIYGGHLLQDSTLDEMLTDYIQDGSGFEYGLGVISYPLGVSIENHGHDGSLIYKSIALHFPSEDLSIAAQQNDDRLDVPGSTGDPFDIFYLTLALLDTYLNYTAPSATADLTRSFENLKITPHPADDVTRIDFKLNTSSHIRVTIGRMDGGALQSTDFGWMDAGQHQLELNLGDIPSGIYLLSMNTSDQRIQKMLVIQ
mgnify:CR=1 FL=1